MQTLHSVLKHGGLFSDWEMLPRSMFEGRYARIQAAIAASGEGTPFRLTLQRDATQAKASVDGDALGKVSHEDSNKVEKRS